jgi:non-ribosomal peptide synthetase component F
MRSQLAGLLAHGHAPLALAQQASGVPPHAPLFTALFNYRHSTRREDRPRTPGIAGVFSRDATNYPLAVTVDDTGDGFGIAVDATAPASPQQVCALLDTCLANLAAALEDAPTTPLRQVQVLGEAERAEVVSAWNDTGHQVPEGTVPELFAAQVGRVPDAVAVACDGVCLSYAELDARASRLAGLLAARGRARRRWWRRVERSAELVMRCMGVLEGRGAYLPVDPGLPG